MNITDIKKYIKKFQEFEESQRSELLLVLVANVDGETQNYDDYQNTSVLSEYYTLDEYENLSISLKKLGYEVISYFNETDFMNAIINNKINNRGMNRPPEVRPKNLTIGGRFSYGKI